MPAGAMVIASCVSIDSGMIGPQKWSPSWIDSTPKPVFHWRHGSVIERAQLEAEAAGEYRAAEVPGWVLQDALATGLRKLLPDDADAEERERLIALAASEMAGETLADADAAILAEARAALADNWPPYRALLAQQSRRESLIPMLTFRRFVTGWDGVTDRAGQPVAYSRDLDGAVSDSALALIDPMMMLVLGLQIFNALYARGLEKNFAPRSKSGSARRISGTARRSPAAGKSAGTSGRKTPR